MNTALCHYRIGETDGVSLEMEKWKTVLEKMGHQVVFAAGSTGCSEGYVIPELGYRHPSALQIEDNAYRQLRDYSNEAEFAAAVLSEKNKIKTGLQQFISSNNILLLIPNNILSLGKNIPAAIAFAEVVRENNLKCIAHHHDFYWERESYSSASCNFVYCVLDKYFPPDLPSIKHVVINSRACRELKEKKGLGSQIIPNVFDYGQKAWEVDSYNQNFREELGIKKNDILLLQATRVTNRKAIELAVDITAELNKLKGLLRGKRLYSGQVFPETGRIILVLAGMIETGDDYVERLIKRAEKQQVEMLFADSIVGFSRKQQNQQRIYSLWDAYVHADIITYPSILEGWGNQFLEGVFARKPLVVFEYQVFLEDIRDKGFEYISLGKEYSVGEDGLVRISAGVKRRAAEKIVELLLKRNIYYETVNKNFNLGCRHYSYQILEKQLQCLLKE